MEPHLTHFGRKNPMDICDVGECCAQSKTIRPGWRYDSCGEVMSDLQAGWVEWVAAEDTKGKPESMASVTNSSFCSSKFC